MSLCFSNFLFLYILKVDKLLYCLKFFVIIFYIDDFFYNEYTFELNAIRSRLQVSGRPGKTLGDIRFKRGKIGVSYAISRCTRLRKASPYRHGTDKSFRSCNSAATSARLLPE